MDENIDIIEDFDDMACRFDVNGECVGMRRISWNADRRKPLSY